MKKSLKKRWVKALMSGKYKQGKGTLKRRIDDGSSEFCCLGVLCDIDSPKDWNDMENDGTYFHNNHGQENELSVEGRQQLGVDIIDMNKLIAMNDGKENGKYARKFLTIAKWIEKNID